MYSTTFVRRGWFAVACLIGLVFAATPAAFSGKIGNYAADQVYMDAKGNIKHTSKLYVAPQKLRMGGLGHPGAGKMVVIVRQDLGVYRMLNPERKVYFERSIQEEDLAKLQATFKPDKEVDLGTEKVGGYTCTKKQITTTAKFMGIARTSESTIWVSDQFDFPMRTRSSDGSVTELRNIKKGKQAKELFEIPKGFRKAANMMEMFDAPREGRAPETTKETDEGGVAEKLRNKLKGFKLPFGNK